MPKSLKGEFCFSTTRFHIIQPPLTESARVTANTTPPYPAGGRWQISGMTNGRKTRSSDSSSASLSTKITSSRNHGGTALAVKSSKNTKKSSRKANWTESKKRVAKFEDMKPKKPPTAFFYFLEDFRKEYQEQNPDVKSMRDIGKACGQKWKTMTYEEKVHYYDVATKKRAEFDRAMADFVKRKESGKFEEDDDDSEFGG
ncbi:high mobility group B protein 14 isoform X2 [Primulina tabacum]|uniref:high mobility group B protein 14 isoform X2 n=1 Tax=Primulina tabacum TaxID=48773 RepID=UPI003F5A6B8B